MAKTTPKKSTKQHKTTRKTAVRKTAKTASADKWFIEVRGSYLPNSREGWLLYIPFIAYLVLVMVTIGGLEISLLGRLVIIVGQFIAAAIVMTWIASKHS